MISDTVIDEDGFSWPATSRELRERNNAVGSTANLLQYLIRNLGAVRLRDSPTGNGVHVSFRPYFVKPATLRMVASRLEAGNYLRFMMHVAGDLPRTEIVSGLEDAVAMIGELPAEPDTACALCKQNLPLTLLEEELGLIQLKSVYKMWRSTGGCLTSAVRKQLNHVTGGRTVLARFAADSAVFADIGNGFATVDSAWRRTAIGRRVIDQPDRRYGAWVADAMSATRTQHAPQFELVEADVKQVNRSSVRVRYERLMLPWREGNEEFVGSASTLLSAFPRSAWSM